MIKIVVLMFLVFFSFAEDSNKGCDESLFSVSTKESGVKIYDLILKLAEDCKFSIVVEDNHAKDMLKREMQTIHLKDVSLRDLFDIVLENNNLFYSYDGMVLKIGYLKTKIFRLDYVGTTRSGSATITGGASNTASGNSNVGAGGGSNTITNEDTFNFWDSVGEELNQVSKAYERNFNDSETSSFTSPETSIVINKLAGMVTITSSKKQMDKLEEYITKMIDRLHKQVLIDVQILGVILNDSTSTGVNWSKFGLNLSHNNDYTKAQTGQSYSDMISGSMVSIINSALFSIEGVISFLSDFGDVKSLSNPKILALNNQPAFIYTGDIIHYPDVTGGSAATNNSGATNPNVESIPLPIGVSLDITPEIQDSGEIILKINPSISTCRDQGCRLKEVRISNSIYELAPDITEKKLSTVVRVKDGDSVILGGLITNSRQNSTTKVPLLGNIPILGYAFKNERIVDNIEEMVVIITPRIVKKDRVLTLEEIGFGEIMRKPDIENRVE